MLSYRLRHVGKSNYWKILHVGIADISNKVIIFGKC